MNGMGTPPPPGTPGAQGGAPAGRSGPVAVRALNLGELLDGGFKLFMANWRTILLVTGVFVVPLQLVSTYLQRDLVGAGMLEMLRDPRAGERFMDAGAGSDLAALLGVVNALVITPLVTGAVASAAAVSYLGGQPDAGSALRAALERWWALIVSWLLLMGAVVATVAVGAAMAGGGAAVGVVGLMVVGVVLFLAGILASLAVAALFAATVPAIVVERLGPIGGLRRSARLLRPRLLAVLGTLVVVGLLLTLLTVALGAVPQVVGMLLGDRLGWLFMALGGTIAGLVTTPMLAIVLTLLYFDGRVRQEGLDLRLTADDLTGGQGWEHGGRAGG